MRPLVHQPKECRTVEHDEGELRQVDLMMNLVSVIRTSSPIGEIPLTAPLCMGQVKPIASLSPSAMMSSIVPGVEDVGPGLQRGTGPIMSGTATALTHLMAPCPPFCLPPSVAILLPPVLSDSSLCCCAQATISLLGGDCKPRQVLVLPSSLLQCQVTATT